MQKYNRSSAMNPGSHIFPKWNYSIVSFYFIQRCNKLLSVEVILSWANTQQSHHRGFCSRTHRAHTNNKAKSRLSLLLVRSAACQGRLLCLLVLIGKPFIFYTCCLLIYFGAIFLSLCWSCYEVWSLVRTLLIYNICGLIFNIIQSILMFA